MFFGKRFHGLFFNALIALVLISIVPVLIIGFHLIRVENYVLQNEVLQKQQLVANRLSGLITVSLASKQQILAEFGDLHTNFGDRSIVTALDLNYLRRRSPSLLYLAVLAPNGKALFSAGTLPAEGYAAFKPAVLRLALHGEDFVSPVIYEKEDMFVWMAVPIHSDVDNSQIVGALVAAVSLRELGRTLQQAYPLDINVIIASAQGRIISYNGAAGGLAVKPDPVVADKAAQLANLLGQKESASVLLQDKSRLLVTRADVPPLNWTIYLDQPANLAVRRFMESSLRSWGDVLLVLGMVLVFVVLVSYVVIIPITRPLERLRTAAVKMRESDDYIVKKEDLEIPHNEIGDLAEVFAEMSEGLHTRREEVMRTHRKLEGMNQELEKRVEERTRELKEANRELVKTERLAAIGQMASIISHEIRNPLAVISNATRLIKMLLRAPEPKVDKQIHIIEQEIKQANSIINEVLSYARTREMMLSMIDVNSYLQDILSAYPPENGLSVVEDFDEESVRVKIDAEEMKQALRNIISNAIEVMPNGGTLRVGTRVGRKLVCIFVSDTGPGITEEVRRKMFAPFFTTKARGTGLGLAVVSKAIARHKGKLFIKSEEGKGTTFQIYLKIYKKAGDTNYGTAS